MVIKTPLGYWRALVGINGCLNQKIPDMKQNLVFRSHRGSPAMLIPVHCVNPNHYHHFHHHHDALSVTVNPAAYVATATAASTAATSCVICHLSSSLFHLHPSRYKWPESRGGKHLAGKINYFYKGGTDGLFMSQFTVLINYLCILDKTLRTLNAQYNQFFRLKIWMFPLGDVGMDICKALKLKKCLQCWPCL